MKQVTNLKNVETDLLLPGIVMSTSPTDYRPIKQLQSPDRKIIMFRLTSRLRAALFRLLCLGPCLLLALSRPVRLNPRRPLSGVKQTFLPVALPCRLLTVADIASKAGIN
jgi:hypothetical protein